MWRGGCRLNISVAASFVWRCLSGSAVTPFPHPAHRTGHADRPHPALGQNIHAFTHGTSCPSRHRRTSPKCPLDHRADGLDPRTVATWVARSRFEPRRSRPRSSVLDPFKPRIIRLLDSHPYSAQQIFQRLREEGYRGGVTILRDYVRCIRPTKRPL